MEDIFKRSLQVNEAQLLYIKELDENFPVRTFFTTKNGGLSSGSYASLNMGDSSGDDPLTVAANRDRAFRAADCTIRAVSYPEQVHKSEVASITRADLEGDRDDRGASGFRTFRFSRTDAVITDEPGVLLTSLHADCIPVWLYDSRKHAAGLVHAGWRGTRADIAAKTLTRMTEELGCRPEDIIAVIGPGISRCCFETGPEVYEEFAGMLPGREKDFAVDDKNGRYHLDLKLINRILLERAGVGRILVSSLCTCCEEDIFYSYRRDGAATGRMCAGICLL